MFKDPLNFKYLKQLYLEQNCEMTYWMLSQIKNLRPLLQIKYTPQDNSWMNKVDLGYGD